MLSNLVRNVYMKPKDQSVLIALWWKISLVVLFGVVNMPLCDHNYDEWMLLVSALYDRDIPLTFLWKFLQHPTPSAMYTDLAFVSLQTSSTNSTDYIYFFTFSYKICSAFCKIISASIPLTDRLGLWCKNCAVFQYNSQFHNVLQVHHAEYKSCNASAPIVTHTSGNDSITITSKGHHFFLCGIPGHCQAGQKVDINVLRVSSSKAPASSATSSSPSSSPAVTTMPPSLSPSEATSLFFPTCRFLTGLCLAAAVTVFLA